MPAHIYVAGNLIVKCVIISDFLTHKKQKSLELTSGGHINFLKSLAHPHVATNVILIFEKITTSFEFLRPQKSVTPDARRWTGGFWHD